MEEVKRCWMFCRAMDETLFCKWHGFLHVLTRSIDIEAHIRTMCSELEFNVPFTLISNHNRMALPTVNANTMLAHRKFGLQWTHVVWSQMSHQIPHHHHSEHALSSLVPKLPLGRTLSLMRSSIQSSLINVTPHPFVDSITCAFELLMGLIEKD
jgi:hypothetical protein